MAAHPVADMILKTFVVVGSYSLHIVTEHFLQDLYDIRFVGLGRNGWHLLWWVHLLLILWLMMSRLALDSEAWKLGFVHVGSI